MPLSDYENNDSEFERVADGDYIVTIDDATGDINEGKCKLKIRYRIHEGPFKNHCLFKDYYISEKTCAKFLPWQFGILGIWKTVRDADNFEKGLQAAIDECGRLMKNNAKYLCTAQSENWEWNGKSGVRTNVIIDSALSGLEEALETISTQASVPPSIDSEEPLPF